MLRFGIIKNEEPWTVLKLCCMHFDVLSHVLVYFSLFLIMPNCNMEKSQEFKVHWCLYSIRIAKIQKVSRFAHFWGRFLIKTFPNIFGKILSCMQALFKRRLRTTSRIVTSVFSLFLGIKPDSNQNSRVVDYFEVFACFLKIHLDGYKRTIH